MPVHVLNMNHCAGSNELPFEKDVSLAELELINLQEQVEELHGSQKISVIRRVNNLRKVIEVYRTTPGRAGEWRILTSYPLSNAYEVESIAHKMLSSHLDIDTPIGEVFACSPEMAIQVVEAAIAKFHILAFEESN
jgi:hypothetical protein